jgi:ABC-type molybdenum transport system ATPase subunit/photorepair protein PhrA
VLDLDAIERRANAATKGPWTVSDLGNVVAGKYLVSLGNWWHKNREDMVFIAHAREDIPALIARVRELEGR